MPLAWYQFKSYLFLKFNVLLFLQITISTNSTIRNQYQV